MHQNGSEGLHPTLLPSEAKSKSLVYQTTDHGVGVVKGQTFVAIFEEEGPDADIGPCDCCYPRDYGTSILAVRNIRIIV